MARGNPQGLSLGPGYIYIAPLGTTEPVDVAATWASISASWVALGYTDDGSQFDFQLSADPIPVAEELDPITNAPTTRAMSLTLIASQITAANLKTALNGGTVTSGTGCVYFEPPDLGTEVRCMIGFESEDHTERWIYRQCFNTGQITLKRSKGAAGRANIPMMFILEKPATGLRPWRAILATPQRQ